jgi:hypothetical protein
VQIKPLGLWLTTISTWNCHEALTKVAPTSGDRGLGGGQGRALLGRRALLLSYPTTRPLGRRARTLLRPRPFRVPPADIQGSPWGTSASPSRMQHGRSRGDGAPQDGRGAVRAGHFEGAIFGGHGLAPQKSRGLRGLCRGDPWCYLKTRPPALTYRTWEHLKRHVDSRSCRPRTNEPPQAQAAFIGPPPVRDSPAQPSDFVLTGWTRTTSLHRGGRLEQED